MRVALFAGCIHDFFFPRSAMAVVRILEHLGVTVEFPEGQTCCGQAHFNSGYRDEARRLARHFVEVFDGGQGAPPSYIVSPSGSCTAMVREFYPAMFVGHGLLAGRARAVASRVVEFTDFLVSVLGQVDLGARFPARAVYHASCHTTRLLHVVEPPLALLRAVEGLELVEYEGAELCCGFGGTFAVKSPELSAAMADAKLDAITAAGAELVISADASCLLHLMGRASKRRLPLRFVHVAELLAEGMGLMEPALPQAERAQPQALREEGRAVG
ncbi:MAG: (Fe-S)-binding protein [Limnochordaceae bacterium]|nr:(Fe-S)-binding protein [Limnochordaceae bacterium]